jgi:hypothetical protein
MGNALLVDEFLANKLAAQSMLLGTHYSGRKLSEVKLGQVLRDSHIGR